MKQGLTHIYCGEGKGKTTSAIGLGVRAAGSGLKVCMIQFLKSGNSSEITALKRLAPDFEVVNYERPFGFFWTLSEEQKIELKSDVQKAFDFAKAVVREAKYDMLILDEVLGVIDNKIIDEEEFVLFLKEKNPSVEMVLTGRYASEKVMEYADYVSKIEPIKHPFEKGIAGRKGIEY